ncbi:hypothetical protein B586_11370 [Mycobacterium haemophilum DSM 44634]|uniref:cytochrome c oxidase assembly protein n=1 Tax=Mycobacterium haemophilum TaxID=29311 RepID=UPI00065630CB|nr:cytochrome c oxidase assembly protein [Mycobacterium haemophilum]AKN17014.1 hypothetical protein B586_11370 [Mycobacterium haemophilum DSM 44634]MCV7340441.1 cytochrome c oxidase assembly protein [Mycobacterium haemophilum DSM 44634]
MQTDGPAGTATSVVPAPRPISLGTALMVAGLLGSAVAVAIYGLFSRADRYGAAGNPDPGSFVSVAEPVGYFGASLSSALCLGALVYFVMMVWPRPDGLIDAQAFRVHLAAERVSIAWLVFALAMVVVQAANDSGVTPAELRTGAALFNAVAASETSRAWIVVAICALLVALTLRVIIRWPGHFVLLIPAVIGVIATAVTGNAGQGPDHDYATSAVIVFALAVATLSGLKITAAMTGVTPSRAVLIAQVVCGVLALAYGAELVYLLSPGAAMISSDFGRLGLVAGVLLTLVCLSDGWALVMGRPESDRRTRLTALAMTAVTAATAAMAVQTAPRFLTHRFTAWDVFLGYELPQPPNIVRFVTVWRFDSLIGAAAIALGIGYLAGFVWVRRAGNTWPVGRLVAWLTGCVALVFTSGSGVRAYGSAMFSVHMAEHMTLNMFIPVLLVLGGPVTLALRALPAAGDGQRPGPREWLTWLMHSPMTAFLSHPITAFILFVGSPYIVYFTPLFDTLVRYHWGHEFMAIHFLLVGYLFYWAIIGIDPGPRRLPYPARIGLLFAVMPFHAFFGIALMTMTSAVGAGFYRSVNLPWLASIDADQHMGGAIAWGATELPVVIVIVALVAQWARQDRRVAVREDRHADSGYADDDLDAYNAMLRELSRMRR